MNGTIQSIHLENGKIDVELSVQNSECESNSSSIFDDNPNKGNIDFQNEN